MGKMDSILLKSKFRGSVLGALMGDCLGSAYEGDELFTAGMKLVIQRSFDKLEGPHFKAPVMQFTDDSAMTYSVAESLIDKTGFDQKDMAKKFVKSYFKEPNRGYGAGVTTVFQKLRHNKFVDVLGPAKEQFNGQGSLGNGGAMRVAPVALFCYKNYELMVDVARKQSQITHTHKTGVDGAILQAVAVHQSLSLDSKEKLDTCKFTDDLIQKMDGIEVDEEGLGLVDPSPYKTQLKLVRDLICEEGDGPHDEKVVQHLGTDISALHSVPTAIYCFLRAQKSIKHVQTENPLRRTIQYAQTSPVSCDTSSVDRETRDSAISVDYDEYDIFAKTIASYLRAMDIETARKARNQIEKVIVDHRLRKPETQSIRLLRPEVSERGTVPESRIEKFQSADRHQYVKPQTAQIATRTIQQNNVPRSIRDIHYSPLTNKKLGLNTAISTKARQSKFKAKRPSFVIEPIITHYKRRASTSTPIRSTATTDTGISLGGDTDTIGSMAGAIAGAFYGEEMLRPEILRHCENSSEFRDLADRLFDLASA